MQNGAGELVVSRRQPGALPENYVPCVDCKAWVFVRNLSVHSKSCPCGKKSDKNFLRNSRMLLSPFFKLNSDDADINHVIDKMKETKKYPGLQNIAKKDKLIREFCRGLIHKLGTDEEQRRKDKDNIRTKIRALSRLLKALNENNQEWRDLISYITSEDFPLIVKVVKTIGLTQPNMSLTLGHYLKQICQLKKSLALQCKPVNTEMKEEAESFDTVFGAHWNNYVSAACLRRLKLLSLNKTTQLPLTEDLVKFKDFLDDEIEAFLQTAQPTRREWITSAQALLARLVIFNKRRISEVEELKANELVESEQAGSDEIISYLDVTEKALANRMKVIEVRGKSTRGLRKVFVILSDLMHKGCLHLLNTRLSVGIPASNTFLFARVGSDTPLDGCEAMRVMSELCEGLEKPCLIRTRLLRKHLATTVQVLDMRQDELKMIADHLGHSVSIHTDVYRLQSSWLEKTKVARALIASENGLMGKYAGRSLSSCNLDEIPVIEEDELIPNERCEKRKKPNDSIDNLILESGSELESNEKTLVKRKKPNKSNSKSESVSKILTSRKRWTPEENNILFNEFKEYIESKRDPSTEQIKDVLVKFPSLKERSVPQIKAKLNNIKLGKCSLGNVGSSC